MANTISELTGLTEEQRLAYVQGMNIEISTLDDFEVTEDVVASITVAALLAPRPFWQKASENAPTIADDLRPGYAPTYEEFDFENGLNLSGKVMDLMKPALMQAIYETFGLLAIQAIAGAATDTIFNDGFSVNGPDGVPLFSASHPTEIGLKSNLISSALDHAAAQSAERALMNQVGRDGQKLSHKATRLIVPVDLMHVGAAVNSPGNLVPSAGTNYAVPNPQAGMFELSVNRYLTSASKWMMVDSRLWKPRINVSRRARPVMKDDPNSAFGKKMLADMTFQVGYNDHYGAVGGGT